jgi:uncharacterized membrane protein
VRKLLHVPKLFAAAKPEHWSRAWEWLFYTLGVGALPFWGIGYLWWLAAEPVTMESLVKDAQLIVYAAGLLAASIPGMQKEVKESPFRHPKWFFWLTLFVILIAALTFGAAMRSADTMVLWRLAIVSVVVTVGALTLGFATELLTNMRDDPNLWSLRQKDLDELGGEVRRRLEDRQ